MYKNKCVKCGCDIIEVNKEGKGLLKRYYCSCYKCKKCGEKKLTIDSAIEAWNMKN